MYKLVPSEHDTGDYSFDGHRLTTSGVNLTLSEREIERIHTQIQEYTKNGSKDYVLIFDNEETGNRVIAIDNLSNTEKETLRDEGISSDEEIAAHNYYTLMFCE